MRAILIVHPVPKDIKKVIPLRADDYIIAVDQAVLSLYKQRIKIDLAVGDFDSLTNKGVLRALNVLKLDPIKDVTDTHQALIEAIKLNPESYMIVGGIGGQRIEHFMAHLLHFEHFPKLRIINDDSEIYMLDEENQVIEHKGYISIFAYDQARVSLEGFKYSLTDYQLNRFDPLGISNELVGEKGVIKVSEGRVLVVCSHRDN